MADTMKERLPSKSDANPRNVLAFWSAVLYTATLVAPKRRTVNRGSLDTQ